MKYKIGLIFSKKDYLYNIDNYGKTYNLIFIIGLVGAGKSTISKNMAKEKDIIILSQDWLAWSEVYINDKIAMNILNEFYKVCPKAKDAAINGLWHKNLLSEIERNEIRVQYNKFLIKYTQKNPNRLYIIEGIDIYKVIDLDEFINRGLIIKGTSVIKCFIRRYKRDKTNEDQKYLNTYNKIQYNENQNSLAAFMKVNGVNIFFGGDVLDNKGNHPKANYVNYQIAKLINERIDIYKVPHHGTINCNSPKTLDIYKPKIAIITNSKDYLQSKSTIYQDLKNANKNVKILLTEKNNIVIQISNDGCISYEEN